MTTSAPDSDEARDALHAVRQQQASLIRRNYAPAPAWHWLAWGAELVLLGLARDLRGPAKWVAYAAWVAALIAIVEQGSRLATRRGFTVRTRWWYRQQSNSTFGVFLADIAVTFLAPVLAMDLLPHVFRQAGLTWPNTLAGAAAGVIVVAGGYPLLVMKRRRLAADAESGSGEKLHGLPRLLSLLPVFEALERRRDRAAASRRVRRTTRGSQ